MTFFDILVARLRQSLPKMYIPLFSAPTMLWRGCLIPDMTQTGVQRRNRAIKDTMRCMVHVKIPLFLNKFSPDMYFDCSNLARLRLYVSGCVMPGITKPRQRILGAENKRIYIFGNDCRNRATKKSKNVKFGKEKVVFCSNRFF